MGPTPLPEDGPGLIRRFLLPAIFVIALFVLLWMRRPDGGIIPGDVLTLNGNAFGTTYTVKIVPDADTQYDKTATQDALTAVIDRINGSMSTYKNDSELSKLNQNPSTEPIPISAELAHVLDTSIQMYKQSGGAFDVTLGPVINAWGFGPDKDVAQPSPAILAAAKARVGSDKLTLDLDNKTLKRSIPNLYIDLSAIAKGYAVDEMGRALEKLGVKRYMVEVGGEIRTRGQNGHDQPWQMGVVRPERDGPQVAELVVPLNDHSMATSGNYRNYAQRWSGHRPRHGRTHQRTGCAQPGFGHGPARGLHAGRCLGHGAFCVGRGCGNGLGGERKTGRAVPHTRSGRVCSAENRKLSVTGWRKKAVTDAPLGLHYL